MFRPSSRLRFRLTHAAWACALALVVGGIGSFTPLRRLAFPAEAFGPAAAWVEGHSAFASIVVFSALAAEEGARPQAASPVAAPAAVAKDVRLHAAPLPAALWPLPPPASAA